MASSCFAWVDTPATYTSISVISPRGLVTTVVELTFSIANMVDAERTFTVISSEDFDGTINW
ncbi:hypothetical protein ALP16_103039 [Pseudomonas savastanoi]|uniref:Uncharacterized protein n=1 Tax=Pseudomonas savastanoi TaxID=29438 RepID=A0A3M6A6J6_PSESS|nr:hypothetical protein ALO74_102942 [Pseudomonas syringae pv. cunninghamiae]RMV14923.1 hypothetical protein ALP17_111903 [Pseudomonas savastanoi]RMV15149.1 hypothetical protein ALP16_103039 [Pseudomonas savastanoi]